MEDTSDAWLPVRVSLHDEKIEKLFDEHFAPLARAVRLLVDNAEEAEDVVQEAFARLLTSRRQMRDIENAPAYLRSTAFNLARSRLRKRGTARRKETLMVAAAHAADAAASQRSSPERHYLDVEDAQRVTAAMQRLPDRQRECIVLRYFLQLSEKEIAETLNISTGSVKTHTSRAMEAMSRTLSGSEQL